MKKREKIMIGVAVLGIVIAATDRALLGSASAAAPSAAQSESSEEPSLIPNTPGQLTDALAMLRRSSSPQGTEPEAWSALFGLQSAPTVGPEVEGAAGLALPRRQSQSGRPLPRLILTAVSTRGEGSAIVNGQVLRVGQSIAGIELVGVEDRSAVIRTNEGVVRVTLPPVR